ncbi:MAG: TlpA disulfide reductase family protein [Chitinophagales bacterium]
MRIPLYSALFFLATFLFSCKTEKNSPFVLEGTIHGAENKDVILETMSFPNINQNPKFTVLDTTTADEKGQFRISEMLPERMICRVRVVGEPNYYILSLHNDKVDLEATLSDQSDPKVNGSEATMSLFGFIDEVRLLNEQMMHLNDTILKYKSLGMDSLSELTVNQRNDLEVKYYTLIKTYADTVSEISNAVIALEGLSYDNEFSFLRTYGLRMKNGPDSSSIYVQELLEKIAQQEKMMAQSFVGKRYIDVVQNDPGGKARKLSDLQGKVVLLDFWASWCGPCRKENPNVVKAYAKYHPKGFEIFSVSLDNDKNAWEKAIKADGLTWPDHVCSQDPRNNQAAADYRVNAIPSSFLINADGIIVAENLRGQALEMKLKELLGE